MRSEERLRQVERVTELPLMALAIALIPLLVVPVVADLPESVESSFAVADWLIWGVFAAVFLVKLGVAPQPVRYVRTHWLEVAMIALPMLRPLRIARLLRLARVATALGFNVRVVRELASARGTKFAAAACLVILVGGATLMIGVERRAEAANIETFGDALWWAASTMTTVGYGDRYPVTPAGRGVAVALMLVGIAALSPSPRRSPPSSSAKRRSRS